MAVLTVNNLTLTLNGITKLDNISFSLHPGERVALLGASGSGKSLTARALSGLPLAGSTMSGNIHFSGQNRVPQQPSIATIFQDTSAAQHPRAPRERRESGHWLLSDFLSQSTSPIASPVSFLGGQVQRVCIALALASQSALLIANEPTTALDVITQAQVLQALKAYTRRAPERALLFITHDIAVATALCQRALILYDGKIVEQGIIDALVRHPQHPYTVALMTTARQQRQLVSQNALALAG